MRKLIHAEIPSGKLMRLTCQNNKDNNRTQVGRAFTGPTPKYT